MGNGLTWFFRSQAPSRSAVVSGVAVIVVNLFCVVRGVAVSTDALDGEGPEPGIGTRCSFARRDPSARNPN